MDERAETARTYYRSIDDDEYDRLGEILAPGFVHDRPDRTLSGAEEFVRFMREERPMTDTTHVVDALYHGGDQGAATVGDGSATTVGDDDSGEGDTGGEVAVRGRLLRGGEDLFGFVDVFAFEGTEISRLRTYTR
jgi:ketosteroid isomerase-like protein